MTTSVSPSDDPPRPAAAGADADPRGAPGAVADAGRAIVSESLFAGAKEVQILHRGSLYRLKQTALGKLILTK